MKITCPFNGKNFMISCALKTVLQRERGKKSIIKLIGYMKMV